MGGIKEIGGIKMVGSGYFFSGLFLGMVESPKENLSFGISNKATKSPRKMYLLAIATNRQS